MILNEEKNTLIDLENQKEKKELEKINSYLIKENKELKKIISKLLNYISKIEKELQEKEDELNESLKIYDFEKDEPIYFNKNSLLNKREKNLKKKEILKNLLNSNFLSFFPPMPIDFFITFKNDNEESTNQKEQEIQKENKKNFPEKSNIEDSEIKNENFFNSEEKEEESEEKEF